MRRLWTFVALGAVYMAFVSVLQLFGALRDADLWGLVTIGMTLLAFYWIAAGAWIRANRQDRTDAPGTPPAPE